MKALGINAGAFVVARAECDIRLYSDDRLDARFFAGLVKVDRAVHIAVVGEADSGHPVFFRQRDHFLNLGETVQKTVMAVGV